MNKKGWSLVGELLAILVAIILLVHVVFGLNKLGLIRNMNEALIPGIKPVLIISGNKVNYDSVESDLKEATRKFVSDGNIDEYDKSQPIIVSVNHLIKKGYISTIRDTDNNECSGYVKITKKDYDYEYIPYLKCSNYKTNGYNDLYGI